MRPIAFAGSDDCTNVPGTPCVGGGVQSCGGGSSGGGTADDDLITADDGTKHRLKIYKKGSVYVVMPDQTPE